MSGDRERDVPAAAPPAEVVAGADEPPVIARMVIEIRSDGSRTIARGALEDAVRGEQVAVRAEGTTPLALALSLARSLVRLPALGAGFARSAARALLPGRGRRP